MLFRNIVANAFFILLYFLITIILPQIKEHIIKMYDYIDLESYNSFKPRSLLMRKKYLRIPKIF
jgi:hypothetical protein